MDVAVLHPGQMGAAVAALARDRTRVMWRPEGRSDATEHRARQANLEPVSDLSELLAHADLVLAICPPAAAEALARDVAQHRYTGVYVEANAISPQRTQRIAEALTEATVVDAGIIGPPPISPASARLYVSGPTSATADVVDIFAGTSLEVCGVGDEIGKASALKMAYAGFQKTSRALAAVSQALAAHHDVGQELQAEAERMGSSPLGQTGYLPSVAARAWRWAPEMREIASTLDAAGLPADFAAAAEQVLNRWEGDKDDWDIGLHDVLARLAAGPDDPSRNAGPL